MIRKNKEFLIYLTLVGIFESWIIPIIENYIIFVTVIDPLISSSSEAEELILNQQITLLSIRFLILIIIIYMSFILVDKFDFRLIEFKNKIHDAKGLSVMVSSFLAGYLSFITFFIIIHETSGGERANEIYNDLLLLNGLISSRGDFFNLFLYMPIWKTYIVYLQNALIKSIFPILTIVFFGIFQRLHIIRHEGKRPENLYPKGIESEKEFQ